MLEMAEEAARLKDEMKSELQKWKDELKQDLLKTSREAFERELWSEMREIQQREMSEGLTFANKTIQELKIELERERANNAELKKKNDALLAKCTTLQSKTVDLEKRVLQVEQYSRNANIEIKGVARTIGGNVMEIVSKIGAAVQEPISESDLVTCHRVPTRTPDGSNIVVQFKSRAKRDVTLKKAKKARLLNSDIGLDNLAPVFVNEHLCPTLKRLLGMATKRKYEHGWKSVVLQWQDICVAK